jgi:hypothetical protein
MMIKYQNRDTLQYNQLAPSLLLTHEFSVQKSFYSVLFNGLNGVENFI